MKKYLCVLITLLACCVCCTEGEKGQNKQMADIVFCIQWGQDKGQIAQQMRGYSLIKETDDLLVFERNDVIVGYGFSGNALSSSMIRIPRSTYNGQSNKIISNWNEWSIVASDDNETQYYNETESSLLVKSEIELSGSFWDVIACCPMNKSF